MAERRRVEKRIPIQRVADARLGMTTTRIVARTNPETWPEAGVPM